MKKIIFTFLIIMMSLVSITLHAQTVLLNEAFNYTAGDSLTAHGWIGHSGTGTNTVLVKSGSLNYNQYPVSTGNSAYLKNSGQDINRSFPGQTSGSVYYSALVKIDSVSTTGDYFMHFLKSSTVFAGRVYVKKSTTNPALISFGILKGSTTSSIVYSAATYSIDSTFLLVLKYKFVTGSATNDSISLFINPQFTDEGIPTLKVTDVASADLDSASSIALRQGAVGGNIYLNVDEIRVTNSWYNAIGYYTTPIVVTTGVSNISVSSATCIGNILANGGSVISARGICYDTIVNPGLLNYFTIETGSTGNYTSNLTGLLQGKTYHYRAYATNTTGTSFGGDSVFTTPGSPILPLLSTDSVYNIGNFSASIASKVISDGGATIISRGVCWNTAVNPTVLNSVSYQPGTTGSYINSIGSLSSNTTYYVKAFATNATGTAYGNELSFSTKIILPVYSIQQVKGVNSSGVADSLNVNCKLTGVVHGLNYATSGLNFFIIDSTAGINVYKTSTLGYTAVEGDKIKIIGKIAQVNGLIEIVPDSLVVLSSLNTLFSPVTVNLPNDTLESKLVKIENLYYLSGWPTTAGSTKTVYTIKGSDTVVLRIYSNCNLQGTAAPTATVSFSITGMVNQNDATSPYTSGYQILPRNIADLAINYGNPVVITGTKSGITQHTALCNGSITTDGGHIITSRGVCYSTSLNPTTADSIRTSTGTTGNFTVNLSNLILNTTYHYKAFGINSSGTFYGSDSLFITTASAVVPVASTNNATAISYTSATVSGTILSDGGDTIITRGICWGIVHNPTTTDSLSIVSGSIGSFSSSLSNLTDNTVYYARAYAVNAVGTGYGNEISFITKKLPVLYNISQVKSVNINGVADSLNVNCKLNGVIHSINFKQTTGFTGLNFYIQDGTAGINVYKTSNLNYIPVIGDSIRVIGKIAQASGLIELAPDSLVLISAGNALHSSLIVSSITEPIESKLVTIQNLTYLSGWPSTAGTTTSVLVLKGSDTVTLRLYSNCNLQNKPSPTGTFNITGIASQIDNFSPYTSGYILIPRDSNDLVITNGIEENTASIFRLYPNPSNGTITLSFEKSMDAELKIYSLVGNLLFRQETKHNINTIDLSDFAKGIYFVNVVNKMNGKSFTEKLIIQ